MKEGFNFLGFHIRKCGTQGTLLTVPHKEKVLKHVRATRAYLDAQKQTPAGHVMKERNPIIRGCAHYYRTVQRNTSSKKPDMPHGRCSGRGRNVDTRTKEVQG